MFGVFCPRIHRKEGQCPGRLQPYISISHRPVVTLQHQRPGRFLIVIGTGTRRSCKLRIFVDYYTVVYNLFKSGVGNLSPVLVKTRRPEYHVKSLPLSRCSRSVDTWGTAFKTLVFVIIPTLINTAAFNARVLAFLNTVAVVDLNFVSAHKVHAGVRPFGNHKLDMRPHIAEFCFAEYIICPSCRTI